MSHEGVHASWLSLRIGSVNHGNFIIDEASWAMLGQPERREYSSFMPLGEEEIKEIDKTPVLVLPGATLLDASEHPISASLDKIRCPKLAIAVALCTTSRHQIDLSIAAAISCPIGSRDPFTHEVLKDAGIDSRLVGCSTLMIGDAKRWEHRQGPVVFSLGRGDQAPLQQCVMDAARHYDVEVVQHVPTLQPRFQCSSGVRWMDLCDLTGLKKIYSRASLVVTGRIHGALPAVALGVPVIFFSSYRDSRFSIVEHLGIECVAPEPELVSRRITDVLTSGVMSTEPLEKASILRNNMRKFLAQYWA